MYLVYIININLEKIDDYDSKIIITNTLEEARKFLNEEKDLVNNDLIDGEDIKIYKNTEDELIYENNTYDFKTSVKIVKADIGKVIDL